jgi:hypothetical protein
MPVLGLVRPVFASTLDSFCASFPFPPFPLGTASGEFLRPAASCLLLFRFLPKNFGNNSEVFLCPSRNAASRLWSSPHSLLGAPITRAEIGETSCTYMLSGIASGRGLLADVSDIRAWFVLQGRIIGRISSEWVPCECRRLQHLHYCRRGRALFYSSRRAAMGSTRIARRAGM